MTSKTGVKALLVAAFGAIVAAGGAVMIGRKKKETGKALPPAQPGAAMQTSAVLTGYPVPPVPQVPGFVAPATAAGTGGAQVVFPTVPSADMQQKVANALASGNPDVMRQVAAELAKAGNTTGAQSLEQIAKGVETTNAAINTGVAAVAKILQPQQATPVTPTPATPLPTTPVPATPVSYQLPTEVTIPPVPGLTTQPTTVQVPAPTVPPATGPSWPETNATKILVAKQMATMLAASKPYAEDKASVKAFQSQEGISPVDGLYGAGTATRLGERYGIVPPKPYYWAKDTSKVPAQKAAYQQAMGLLAAKDPARAAQWQAAGNVYSSAPAPVSMPSQVPQPSGLPTTFTLPGGIPVSLPAAVPEGILTSLVAWPETNPVKVDVANRMNLMLAAKRPYSEDTSLVKAFQAQEGISPVDGLYGPGTATKLGEQYGIVPVKPYYWSKTASKVPAQKSAFRAAMTALSIKDPLRAAQWLAAAQV